MKHETHRERLVRLAAAREAARVVELVRYAAELRPHAVEIYRVFTTMQSEGFTAEDATELWTRLIGEITAAEPPK